MRVNAIISAAILLALNCVVGAIKVGTTNVQHAVDGASPSPRWLRQEVETHGDAFIANEAVNPTTTQPPLTGALSDDRLKPNAAPAVHNVYDPVTGLTCELVAECHACPVTEKDEVYCRETGYRQELSCPLTSKKKLLNGENEREIRFKACSPEEKANPIKHVMLFEVVMAGSLVAAFMMLQKERRKHMSSFDLRKDPKQRSTLLAPSANKDHD